MPVASNNNVSECPSTESEYLDVIDEKAPMPQQQLSNEQYMNIPLPTTPPANTRISPDYMNVPI